MHEKSKNKEKSFSFLQTPVPLWLVVIIGLLFLTLNLLNTTSSPVVEFFTITNTPAYFTAPNTSHTFIETMASPTPNIKTTAEVEVNTNIAMCHEMERSSNGQFVFRIFLQNGMELFRIDEDGENFCRLTKNTGNDDYPAWSPDGTKITYVSNHGDYGLYIMNADGNQIEMIHTGGSAYSHPTWSPDGKYIVFQATFEEQFDLYRFELATGAVTNLTNQERLDSMPSYSPDGKFIVFISDRTFNPFINTNIASQSNNYEIYVMDSDGLNPRRITVNNQTDGHPTFSPDGTQMVHGVGAIYIMNYDGSQSRRLSNGYEPVWLPDGHITYINGANIHTILPDGSEGLTIIDEIPIFGSGIKQLDYTPPHQT